MINAIYKSWKSPGSVLVKMRPLLLLLFVHVIAQNDTITKRSQLEKDLKSLRLTTLKQLKKVPDQFHSTEDQLVEIAGQARDIFLTKVSIITENSSLFKKPQNATNSSWSDCYALFRTKVKQLTSLYRSDLEDYVYNNVEKYLKHSKSQINFSQTWLELAEIHFSFYKCHEEKCYNDISKEIRDLSANVTEGKIAKFVAKVNLDEFRNDVEDYALQTFIRLYNDVFSRWKKLDDCLDFMNVWNNIGEDNPKNETTNLINDE